jgi:hypothetical protein
MPLVDAPQRALRYEPRYFLYACGNPQVTYQGGPALQLVIILSTDGRYAVFHINNKSQKHSSDYFSKIVPVAQVANNLGEKNDRSGFPSTNSNNHNVLWDFANNPDNPKNWPYWKRAVSATIMAIIGLLS